MNSYIDMPIKLDLRPYQQECIDSIKENFKQGINRQLCHLATGAGKTVIFSHLTKICKQKTLVLAHTCELLEQACDKMNTVCPELEVGLVKGGVKDFDKQVVISTIQSAIVPKTLQELKDQNFKLCIYDEAHRAGADSARSVLKELGFMDDPKKLLVGFSATPFRTDSKGLGEVFSKTVYVKNIKELIKLGFLCKPKGLRIKADLDLSVTKTADGDFTSTSLASVMDTDAMNEFVVKSFIDNASERKALCFSVTVDHAKHLSEEFNKRGISSAMVCGATPQAERDKILDDFAYGSTQVLTNCTVLTEGYDCSKIDCVIVAKPTLSKGLFQQMAGRGLRLYPNKKDCLIMLFSSKSHSLCGMAELSDDAERESVPQEPKESEFIKELPITINKELKAILESFDMLGDEMSKDFTWKEHKGTFTLKGNECELEIYPMPYKKKRLYGIRVSGEAVKPKVFAENVLFDYAFARAQQIAHDNKYRFVVSDLNAAWRNYPITDKQKEMLAGHGFAEGIDDLTKGQAAMIIGALLSNKKRRKKT